MSLIDKLVCLDQFPHIIMKANTGRQVVDMAKNINWIPHDLKSRRDRRLIILMKKYGLEGYARYWFIKEMIGESADGKLRYSGEYDKEIIMEELKMETPEELTDFMNCCVELGLFKMDKNDYWDKEILDSISTYNKRVEKCKQSAKERWEKEKKKEEWKL